METPYPVLVRAMTGAEITHSDVHQMVARIEREIDGDGDAMITSARRRQATAIALAFFNSSI
ncbi:hypothetical protein [Parasphingorhabdus sp.]|uniref:hypothetical protein n=1 Tax=Parasphingorhabdus sp. TaxID=2709688 RepID=UPI003A8D43E1